MCHNISKNENSLHPFETLETFSGLGASLCVQLIKWKDGRRAVVKVYAQERKHFFDHEVAMLRELKKIDVEDIVPPLLEVGENYFVIPYYKDTLRRKGLLFDMGFRLLPLRVVRKIFKAVKVFHEHGYVLTDFAPHNNLLLDARQGPKLVDYEFAYRVEGVEKMPFLESYTIRGVPDDWPRDKSAPNMRSNGRFYEQKWRVWTGLPAGFTVDHPVYVQYVVRFFCAPCYWVGRALQRIVEWLRKIFPDYR